MDTQESDQKEFIEEELSSVSEEEYAGLTQCWLIKTILTNAMKSMLLREKKHKYTTIIQSVYRGHEVRKRIRKMKQAAIKIQKVWRGFSTRMVFYKMLKDRVKFHTEAYHCRAARTIQAAFRGYYSRKYIHDHCKLKQLRVQSAQEVLQCVAIKTRELLKNHQLPGVYSLRNSICLSKVEKLVASLRLKTYNVSVREARAEEVDKLKVAFERSMRSKYRTAIPYGSCEQKPGSFTQAYHKIRSARKSDETKVNISISDLSLQLYKKRSTRDIYTGSTQHSYDQGDPDVQ